VNVPMVVRNWCRQYAADDLEGSLNVALARLLLSGSRFGGWVAVSGCDGVLCNCVRRAHCEILARICDVIGLLVVLSIQELAGCQ
jgi:hypothetical protein